MGKLFWKGSIIGLICFLNGWCTTYNVTKCMVKLEAFPQRTNACFSSQEL